MEQQIKLIVILEQFHGMLLCHCRRKHLFQLGMTHQNNKTPTISSLVHWNVVLWRGGILLSGMQEGYTHLRVRFCYFITHWWIVDPVRNFLCSHGTDAV